ncbi:hypothetical protein TorRG33x02_253310 [Trema orientale]|uniref:Uncharacterized protein n=1 Tax=Trema orientale TaxID=63057 RepID=A0A2P5DF74_TREOI|nr:hypothetical protein TorRG33x02_253310 [Trema orientale]
MVRAEKVVGEVGLACGAKCQLGRASAISFRQGIVKEGEKERLDKHQDLHIPAHVRPGMGCDVFSWVQIRYFHLGLARRLLTRLGTTHCQICSRGQSLYYNIAFPTPHQTKIWDYTICSTQQLFPTNELKTWHYSARNMKPKHREHIIQRIKCENLLCEPG